MGVALGSHGEPGERAAIVVTVRGDGVAVLTYDVPGEAVNTLRASFAGEVERALTEIAEDANIQAAVLVSGKEGSFITGADVEAIAAVTTAAEAEALCRRGHEAVAKIAASPKPIVAAIHGAALGGGLEVALACQGRVLSDDRKTVLALPEAQLGLLPGMNGLQRLATIAGLQAALEYGMSGKPIRPSRARVMGLADDVVPQAILVDVAARLASKLAEEGEAKRAWRGRKKGMAALTELALEANPIGRAVLFRQARAEMLAKTGGHYPAPGKILLVLEAFAKKGFEASKDVEAQAFGELAVSSVARNLIAVFFATTALKNDTGVDVAAHARHPESVVEMHYFSPVHERPLLEVITTRRTAPEVVATAVAIGEKQGKTVIVVNDGVGCYMSRILASYTNEAAWLVSEGVASDVIDRALVAWGWAVGPLTLRGEVRIDVAAHVGPILREAFGARFEAPPAVERRVGDKPRVALEEIQMRCSLQLVNEALRCFGEGLLRSARDGDIGAIFGLGFPPFRGGPFRYVDSLGAPEALKRIEAYHRRFGERWAPAPTLVEMARRNGRFYAG